MDALGIVYVDGRALKPLRVISLFLSLRRAGASLFVYRSLVFGGGIGGLRGVLEAQVRLVEALRKDRPGKIPAALDIAWGPCYN